MFLHVDILATRKNALLLEKNIESVIIELSSKMNTNRIEETKMEFGEKVKQARENKGMTQQTLADSLYVTRQAVSKWECGSRYPDLLTTKCLANILGVSIDSLVSDDEMRDYSEKQAIMEGQKIGKLQTALYAIVFLLAVLELIPFIYETMILIVDKNTIYESLIISRLIINLAKYITIGAIALWGVIASVKNNLDAKLAGFIGIAFSAYMIASSAAVIMISKSIASLSLIVAYLFYGAIIGMHFVKRKGKLAPVIYCTSALYIVGVIAVHLNSMLIYLKNGEYYIVNTIYAREALTVLINIMVILVIVFQTFVLERKRRRA